MTLSCSCSNFKSPYVPLFLLRCLRDVLHVDHNKVLSKFQRPTRLGQNSAAWKMRTTEPYVVKTTATRNQHFSTAGTKRVEKRPAYPVGMQNMTTCVTRYIM